MDSEGVVFRNVDELSTLEIEEPIPSAKYSMGVDLAKYRDFTVVSVMRGKKQVYIERFNKIDWALQKSRIMYTAQRYNDAEVMIDSTGVGDPIFEDLNRMGLNILAYQLNTRSKRELIDNLIVLMDKKEVQLLNHAVQKAELKAYEYELTSGGNLRMNAPEGKHDDTVIALALSLMRSPEPTALAFIREQVEEEARQEHAARTSKEKK